jgi:hypothetical protein
MHLNCVDNTITLQLKKVIKIKYFAEIFYENININIFRSVL